MKIKSHACYLEEEDPKEAAIAPLCYFVLESKEEVMEVLKALCPEWACIERVEFKHGCHLAGQCKRIIEGCLATEDFILTFYGDVFLTTVLHELAHVSDCCRHGHGKEFKTLYRTLIKEAKQKFHLDVARVPLMRREESTSKKPKRRSKAKEMV